jgi:glycerol kinase
MAFQTRDLIAAMEKDAGLQLQRLKVDGGASVNNGLMQFQADILGARVQRPLVSETTALGAAYLAGLAVGYWQDDQDVARNWKLDREFQPQMADSTRSAMYARWQKAVSRALAWEDRPS